VLWERYRQTEKKANVKKGGDPKVLKRRVKKVGVNEYSADTGRESGLISSPASIRLTRRNNLRGTGVNTKDCSLKKIGTSVPEGGRKSSA